MNRHSLAAIYRLFLESGEQRICRIEQILGFDGTVTASADDKRNEPQIYADLFAGSCRHDMEVLYVTLLQEMRTSPFEQCDELIAALAFFQLVAATALWKYSIEIGQVLEIFAREFDRLDVASERLRLYRFAAETK